MKLIATKAQFMTDIFDIVRSLRLQIPQNFGILNMCLSLRGRKKGLAWTALHFPELRLDLSKENILFPLENVGVG